MDAMECTRIIIGKDHRGERQISPSSGDMAESHEGLEGLLRRAEKHERDFDWKAAAEVYCEASKVLPSNTLLQLGNVEELRAHCLYRHAFQAETKEEFEERTAKAIEQYGKAKGAYSRLGGMEASPWSQRCDAMTAFLRFWPEADIAQKKKLIGEAWDQARGALNAFEEARNYTQFGKTNDILTLAVSIGYIYSTDFKFREHLIGEGLQYSEKALKFLSETGDKAAIARAFITAAYYTRLFCSDFVEMSKRGEWDKRAGELFSKGLETSRKDGIDAILFSYKFGIFPSSFSSLEEQQSVREAALEYALRTHDLVRMACAFEWKGNRAFTLAHEAVDVDQIISMASEALDYAEKSRRCYLVYTRVFISESVIWSGAPYAGFCALLASLMTDLEKKREFALKGVPAFEDELRIAQECDYPEGVDMAYWDATQILTNLAKTEKSSENKKKILERSLDFAKRYSSLCKTLHPLDYDFLGAKASLAEIEHELADLEVDANAKISLYRLAVSHVAEDYEDLRKGVSTTFGAIEIWGQLRLPLYQYQIATWLSQLYEVSKEKDDLVKAAEAFQKAFELYTSAHKPSWAAESCWKAAQIQDSLGDRLGSSERFQLASDSYKEAVEKMPSLKVLYLQHSSYMLAWSEIEKAIYHHAKQEPASSKEHYSKAARLHESAGRMSFLSTNYFAWAQVENAEDLSQRERCTESIEAFGEASRLFMDSKSKMQKQLESIKGNDERQMVERLISAADDRQELCRARIVLEEARILDKEGSSGSAAEKFGFAADTFARIKQGLAEEQDRKEIELIITLSKAWKAMAKAEADDLPGEYAEAATLFELAKGFSPGEKAKALAMGHSRFCKALEAGARFADTRNLTFHASAIKHLDSAANYYARAGADSASEYSRASKLMFDAHALMDRAGQEPDHEKKAKAYLAVEKTLEASAAGFRKAVQPGKAEQVLRLLESVKREREFAVSLTELLRAPLVLSSTASFAGPVPSHEQPVGSERFEHADIQANLILTKNDLKEDEDLNLGIELVNAGRGLAQLVKLQDVVPDSFTVRQPPKGYQMEGSHLNLGGKRLDPLMTEEINLVLKPNKTGRFDLKPRILYLDEGGKYKSHEPEPMRITVGLGGAVLSDKAFRTDTHEAAEARALLSSLNVVTLSHYRIVGNYVRYGDAVCNTLKNARQKIVAACTCSSSKRENYVIWAPPGSGKTYFVQEIAALLGDSIRYRELNLAKLDETGFRSGLAQLREDQKPCLCLVDEVDARPDEPWPYEALLPFLDLSASEEAQLVFVLAGSSGSNLDEMKKHVASRPKGSDVLSRVPAGNEYTIPPMGVGDRLLVVLSQFRQAGKQMGHEVREVEKLGLYYVALNARLSNARQLHEFAVRCAERVLPGDDRLKYDSLFDPGDRENKVFWTHAVQSADALVDSFLLVED